MAGSSFGNQFRITTWGESHGKGLGVVIDGCPAGLSLSEGDIQKYLDRRKPGVSQYVTKRKESDTAKIMSGVFEGRTTDRSDRVPGHEYRRRTNTEIILPFFSDNGYGNQI